MTDHERPSGGFFSSRAGLVLIAFLVIIGFLLTTEHRAHTLSALLWLLILACPLLHMFMHGGHGGHAGHHDAARDARARPQPPKEASHEH